MKWKPHEIKKLESLAAQNFEAFDIARALGTKTHEVRAKARELGIRINTSKKKSTIKGEPVDEYDFKVIDAVRAGCNKVYDVVKYTTYNPYRIKEINNRLKLGIDFKAHDNQCSNMLATSFSRTY